MKFAPMAELVDATDSKSVELRFMSVRVGLGVPRQYLIIKRKPYPIFIVLLKEFNQLQVNKKRVVKLKLSIRLTFSLIKKMLFL